MKKFAKTCLGWKPVTFASPEMPSKVQRTMRGENIQFQRVTRSVLNPRSREVRRDTGRERVSGPSLCDAVRRFTREARGYWRFQRGKIPRRTLVAEELAEGGEPQSNVLSQEFERLRANSLPKSILAYDAPGGFKKRIRAKSRQDVDSLTRSHSLIDASWTNAR